MKKILIILAVIFVAACDARAPLSDKDLLLINACVSNDGIPTVLLNGTYERVDGIRCKEQP